jgi:hypothetical protein
VFVQQSFRLDKHFRPLCSRSRTLLIYGRKKLANLADPVMTEKLLKLADGRAKQRAKALQQQQHTHKKKGGKLLYIREGNKCGDDSKKLSSSPPSVSLKVLSDGAGIMLLVA